MSCSDNITISLAWSIFLTNLGSAFLIGYNLGIINLPAPYIKEFLQETILYNGSSIAQYHFIDASFLYAQASTAFVVAGAIGAFSCGFIADLIGRRTGLWLNNILAIAGAICAGLCKHYNLAWLLYVGRFLSGLNCGITIGLASIYLMEIAPRSIRGAVGATNQLAITLGIVISYVVTLTTFLNRPNLWPVAIALSGLPALVSFVFLLFCPESPRFLYIKKNDRERAEKAFCRLNGSKVNVAGFFEELDQEVQALQQQPAFKFCQLFSQKDIRLAVIIAVLIQILQQLSGINAVITYSSTMLETAGIHPADIQYFVLAIGAINVVMTVISLPLLERAGRRTLLLWPSMLLAVALFALTILVTVVGQATSPEVKRALGITSAVFIFIYICGFALGLGPIPAMIVSEIFCQGPRASAYSLSQGIQWCCNLIVLCSYPSINAAIGGYSFIPFLVIVVVCLAFFWIYMPETRNRKFEDIATDLAEFRVYKPRRQSNGMTLYDVINGNVFTK